MGNCLREFNVGLFCLKKIKSLINYKVIKLCIYVFILLTHFSKDFYFYKIYYKYIDLSDVKVKWILIIKKAFVQLF